ncbi:MAG: hypothetical protein ACD_30C00089G0008 [uncultured bacterium]|nr:MAG: hypothetical protein ACD_30C00089G0008 [uncultured bacterium]
MFKSILHIKQFRYLGAFYLHSLIRFFTVGIFQIFSGIYVYQILLKQGLSANQSLSTTALVIALLHLVQAVAIPLAIWIISKKGLRFSVFWGNIFLILFLITLNLAQFDMIFLIIASILGGIELGFYWMAYHIFFVELTDDKKQGEEVAISSSLSAIALVGAPAFGGLLISYYGYNVLFLAMIVLVFIAIIPLKYLPKQEDRMSISIWKTALALSPKKEAKSYLALTGQTADQLTSEIFWPIFAITLVSGIIGIGFMGSLIALFATISTLLTGYIIDRFGPKKIIKIISSLDAISGLTRSFVTTPMHVFLSSIVTSVTNQGQFITLDTIVYERARHEDVMSIITQREVAASLGRVIFLIPLGILFWFGMPFPMLFVITAVFALTTRFYPYVTPKDKSYAA